MRRNIILIIALMLFFGIMITGVLYLNNPKIFDFKKEDPIQNTPEIQYVRYPVCSGEIVHTYEVEGAVISQAPEIYIEEVVVDYVSDTNFQMQKNKGDILSAGDVLYQHNGANKTVDFSAKLIETEYVTEGYNRKAVIRLLNYDKLYIVTNVKEDKINKLSYDTEVDVQINGKTYSSKVINIGYEIVDKEVPVSIALPENVLPGTNVKITFVLDIQKAGLYVPQAAIYQDNDTYYANVLSNGGVKQKKITVGQNFSVEEDGNVFEYIEILSGVSEGDTIVVEQIDATGAGIKENLND